MPEQKTAIEELAEVLENAGCGFTFSRWCASGLLGRCECRRCRGSRGEVWNEATEHLARAQSIAAQKRLRGSVNLVLQDGFKETR